MARKATASRATPAIVVTTPAAPVRRRRSGGTTRRRPTKSRRRTLNGGKASFKSRLMGVAMGGAAFGFVMKQWGDKIPNLPLIGRSGAVALGCYMFAGNSKLVQDMGIASAAIAGYSFAKTGVVEGDDDDDTIAEQM
jgi:hypothetical protein